MVVQSTGIMHCKALLALAVLFFGCQSMVSSQTDDKEGRLFVHEYRVNSDSMAYVTKFGDTLKVRMPIGEKEVTEWLMNKIEKELKAGKRVSKGKIEKFNHKIKWKAKDITCDDGCDYKIQIESLDEQVPLNPKATFELKQAVQMPGVAVSVYADEIAYGFYKDSSVLVFHGYGKEKFVYEMDLNTESTRKLVFAKNDAFDPDQFLQCQEFSVQRRAGHIFVGCDNKLYVFEIQQDKLLMVKQIELNVFVNRIFTSDNYVLIIGYVNNSHKNRFITATSLNPEDLSLISQKAINIDYPEYFYKLPFQRCVVVNNTLLVTDVNSPKLYGYSLPSLETIDYEGFQSSPGFKRIPDYAQNYSNSNSLSQSENSEFVHKVLYDPERNYHLYSFLVPITDSVIYRGAFDYSYKTVLWHKHRLKNGKWILEDEFHEYRQFEQTARGRYHKNSLNADLLSQIFTVTSGKKIVTLKISYPRYFSKKHSFESAFRDFKNSMTKLNLYLAEFELK